MDPFPQPCEGAPSCYDAPGTAFVGAGTQRRATVRAVSDPHRRPVRTGPDGRRAPGALTLLLAWAALTSGVAFGQADPPAEAPPDPSAEAASAAGPVAGTLAVTEADPQPWIALSDLARLLGAERVVSGDTVVLRADGVVVTAQVGSPDATVAGDLPPGLAGERALSAPLRRSGDEVLVPLDVAGLFGADRVGDERLRDPSGRLWALRIEPAARVRTDPGADLLHPAPGVVAVELRTPSDGGVPEALAAWAVDLVMAPLVAPWTRAAVDAAAREAGDARALLLVVTSTEPEQRHPGLSLRPDGAEAWTEAGARHETIAGAQDAIGPEAPWVAVVWLPTGARLDRPLELAAGTVRATVTFRR